MMFFKSNDKVLGINGLGRIGKLSLWYQLLNGYFDGYVINMGRDVGRNLEDIIGFVETDSTYGSLSRFLHGYGKKSDISIVDRAANVISIDGVPVKFLLKNRNPRDIGWKKEGVRVVVDCTGRFRDPVEPGDSDKGSLRGHLDSGAEKVIVSAPFKVKDGLKTLPEDSGMFVYGINHNLFNPQKHHVLSAASCTTTGLSHMMKPLMDDRYASQILTASMSTVHAATNTQSILDSVPKAGQKDQRKSRSMLDNIIITSTGAAKALEFILPEISSVGFMADSVRIPTDSVSLIVLNLTFKSTLDELNNPIINRAYINKLFQNAASNAQKGLLVFSDKQNVSGDLKGEMAAMVVEGCETHTRTGFIQLDGDFLADYGISKQNINVPVTHAKICGWYDNEMGSYVYCLGKLIVHTDKNVR